MCNIILGQFYRGFRMMRKAGHCVTVFGSARTQEEELHYKSVYDIGQLLAKLEYTTLTGGGAGLMEAANRGAFENGGKSYGCNILLPFEQDANPYLHKHYVFDYFFIRNFMLTNFSVAYIVAPGGFGTLYELFSVSTLIQTGVIAKRPIVIYNSDYHKGLKENIDFLISSKMTSQSESAFIHYVDTIEELEHFLNTRVTIKAKKKK